jgi:predicted ATPase
MSTHPPLITELRVRNYRVLRDVTVKKLQPFTALLGPNGSGKSTLFDVFTFLWECFTTGVRAACDARNGLTDLRSRGESGPVVVEFKYKEDPRARLMTYKLVIDQQHGRPVVAEEVLRWSVARGPGHPTDIVHFKLGEGDVYDETSGARTREARLSAPDVLAVNALGQFKEHPRVEALRRFISGWYLSYLSAEATRGIPVSGPQERLSRTGDNLANVLQYLKEQHEGQLDAILGSLQGSVPALEAAQYRTSPDGRLVLFVKDKPFAEPVLARHASDGTLKLLSYLVILNDPDPAPFIGIEEPENHLYATVLGGLADQCRDAAAASQVLVTTHSYEFVNACRIDELVALYRGRDGYTRVLRPSEDKQVKAMVSNGAEPGWLWRQGYFNELPMPVSEPASLAGVDE